MNKYILKYLIWLSLLLIITVNLHARPWWEVFFTEGGLGNSQSSPLVSKKIIKLIEGVPADGYIYVAMYNFSQKDILGALNTAANRGVDIKIIFDQDCKSWNPGPLGLNKNVKWGLEKSDSDEMHHKFAIFNGECIWTGGANWTGSGTSTNDDNAMLIYDPTLVANYQSEFFEMWGGGLTDQGICLGNFKENKINKVTHIHSYHNCLIENYFSSGKALEGPQEYIHNLLINTQESIFFMANVFTTSLKFHEDLINLHRQGKIVEGIFDPQTAQFSNSAYPDLNEALIEVRVRNTSNKMHAKVFIIDQELVVTGSYNWSYSAENKNDENSLLVRNEALAREYLKKFHQLQRYSTDELPISLSPHKDTSLPQVESFRAYQVNNDITCEWSPTPETVADFSRYYLFLSKHPIKTNFDIGDGLDDDGDGQIDEDPLGDFNEDENLDDDLDGRIDEDRNLRPVKVVKNRATNKINISSQELYKDEPLEKKVNYYLAIVAVDKQGNESILNQTGPLQITEITEPVDDSPVTLLPSPLSLYNYPNPINLKTENYTTIKYILPKDAKKVDLKLYSLSGELIRKWDKGSKAKGTYQDIIWDVKNRDDQLVTGGIYTLLFKVEYEDDQKDIDIKVNKVAIINK
ncbi:hypothetical protein KJ849_01910 [bacterium]|nr:hypothetical protein [bacterium]